jgi:hypothetical protein
LKTRQRQHNTASGEAKPLPLVELYDGNLHDFIANLRRVDGSMAPHEKYGMPVNIFAAGRKFWVKTSTSAFGCLTYSIFLIKRLKTIISIILFIFYDTLRCCDRFFTFLVLDKAILPYLVKYFDIPIFHPTSEKTLDELLNAEVDL